MNTATCDASAAVSCPGCSGAGVATVEDAQVQRCQRCGGIFTDRRQPITREQAQAFVSLQQPMLANAGAAGSFFFDLDVINPNGWQPDRLHGWADRSSRRVVQWG